MRRSDRQVTGKESFLNIISHSLYASLAIQDNENKRPYIVPVNYGVKWENNQENPIFYIHSAKEGRKIDLIKQKPLASLSVVGNTQYKPALPGNPCSAGVRFESIYCEGRVEIVEDEDERIEGLKALLRKYGEMEGPLIPKKCAQTAVIKFTAESITGKSSK